MSLVTIKDTYLTNIANAIRSKSGTDYKYKPKNMAAAINAIPTSSGASTTTDAKAVIERTLSGSVTVDVDYIGNHGLAYSNEMTILTSPAQEVKDYGCCECKYLYSVSMPRATEIGVCAFSSCSNLVEVDIPAVVTIHSSAFQFCSNLEKLDLYDIGYLYGNLFAECPKFKTVIIRSTSIPVIPEGSDPFPQSFRSNYEGTDRGYIYVPASMIAEYQNFDPVYSFQGYDYWNKYSYRAIEDYPEICG